MATDLTRPQQRALNRLREEYEVHIEKAGAVGAPWLTAYELQESIATLDALAKRGLAEKYTPAFGTYLIGPRSSYKYRFKVQP
jgi:hypothetical protein